MAQAEAEAKEQCRAAQAEAEGHLAVLEAKQQQDDVLKAEIARLTTEVERLRDGPAVDASEEGACRPRGRAARRSCVTRHFEGSRLPPPQPLLSARRTDGVGIPGTRHAQERGCFWGRRRLDDPRAHDTHGPGVP